jgi:hypothetical protein
LFLLVAMVPFAAAFVFFASRGQTQVSIRVDGQDIHIRPQHSSTIGEALNEAGIRLGPLDRVSPLSSSSLSSSLVITVVRVASLEEIHQVSIPFNRIVSEDARLVHGLRRIAQSGLAGTKEIREMVTTQDGVEVARHIAAEEIIQQPRSEIVVVGTRSDPTLDGFRDNALSYLGRGGVTRLSPGVVEQTMFELARLQGDRYGSVKVLTANGRPWLVLDTFARTSDDASLFIFWWADELHAYGQILNQGLYLLDARTLKTSSAVELGLIVSHGQGSTLAPQFLLLRLPGAPDIGDTWGLLWSSQGLADWRSNQGTVTLAGDGLDRLEVQGSSSTPDSSAGIAANCPGCPRRRFVSNWQRQGDGYVMQSQVIVASPYTALWSFLSAMRSGNMTDTLPLVSGTTVISSALNAGLNRPDLQWTTSGGETDTAFDLRNNDATLRITLTQRGSAWIVTGISTVAGQGRILFTATRPVVHGLFSTDTSGSSAQQSLGEGQHYLWSPDYARIAYDVQGQVYVVNSDGSGLRAIGPGMAPSWSADSKRLAYERSGDKGPLVIVVDLDSGRETTLVAGSRPAWSPGHGASSQRLAYFYTASPNQPPSVYMFDLTSGATSVIASDGNDPAWSPDGAAIAMLTSRGEIVVVTLDPGHVSTAGKGWGYTWSPDGQRLAFLSAKPAGRPLVWDKATGAVKPLLEREDVDGLSWSPEGKELVLSLTTSGGLWLVGSDGSNLRKLGDGQDPVWSWSPRSGR